MSKTRWHYMFVAYFRSNQFKQVYKNFTRKHVDQNMLAMLPNWKLRSTDWSVYGIHKVTESSSHPFRAIPPCKSNASTIRYAKIWWSLISTTFLTEASILLMNQRVSSFAWDWISRLSGLVIRIIREIEFWVWDLICLIVFMVLFSCGVLV